MHLKGKRYGLKMHYLNDEGLKIHYLNDEGLKAHTKSVKDFVVSKEWEPFYARNLAKFFLLEKFEFVKDSFCGLPTKVRI